MSNGLESVTIGHNVVFANFKKKNTKRYDGGPVMPSPEEDN